MKKKNLLPLGLILCAILFTGCHGSKGLSSFETPNEFDTSKNYEISFWAKNDTNKVQTEIYEKAVKDFHDIYPNITVNIRLYNDYAKIYNDVITNISTNTTPNVCITYPDHIATYMEGNNTVVPLDNLLYDASYGLGGSKVGFDAPTADEIVPAYLSEGILADHYYAVPYMRSTEALYINEDFVNKLGYTIPDVVTWDFVWEVSEKANEKNPDGTYKINGQNVMIPFIYKSTDNCMIQQLKQLDAGYSDENGNILIFNDTTKELLGTFYEHAKTGAFSTFKISSYPANFLNAGQCVFAVDSTAGSTWMGSEAPLLDISADALVSFNTVVKPVPQFDPDNPIMISQGPSICIFNKDDPQEVLASWLFTQFLLTNDVQIAYAETEGYVPVTLKAQSDDAYIDYLAKGGTDKTDHYSVKIDATKLLINNINNTFVTPVFNGSASLREASGHLIESVTKAARRKQDVNDEALNKIFNDTASLYHLDSASSNSDNIEGPLPTASKVLLGTLAFAWIMIAVFFIIGKTKEKKAA